MTIKELKEEISNLPDDMPIVVEIDAEAHPLNGVTSLDLLVEVLNGKMFINAKYEW